MKYILIFIIRLYKTIVSPVGTFLFGNACRFTPTCSDYAMAALQKYGTAKGSALAIKRILKCHPWGSYGYDPV